MLLQRRHWLLGAAAWACSSAWGQPAEPRSAPVRVLTAWNQGERSWAGLWSPHAPSRGIALPARAHQVLALPPFPGGRGPQALAVARRPGEYLLRFDPLRSKPLQWHAMEEDRYLAGHAVLSSDTSTLFTTETDGATGEGLVVARDPLTLVKRREFSSGGIGPHALQLEPATPLRASTLLVANGGILNLPETGRRQRNPGRMDSNLTRLDPATGAVLATFRLDDPDLSLRHLARAPDGTVGVALQAEHTLPERRRTAPAMALLDATGLRALPMPAMPSLTGTPLAWDGYAGDILYAHGHFWVSAPHAGLLLGWSGDGIPSALLTLPGAGALASHADGWLVGGRHEAWQFASANPARAAHRSYALSTLWDNHADGWPGT